MKVIRLQSYNPMAAAAAAAGDHSCYPRELARNSFSPR